MITNSDYQKPWFKISDYMNANQFSKYKLNRVPDKFNKQFNSINELWETLTIRIQEAINLYFNGLFDVIPFDFLNDTYKNWIKKALFDTFEAILNGRLPMYSNVNLNFTNNSQNYSLTNAFANDNNAITDMFTVSAIKYLNMTNLKWSYKFKSWDEAYNAWSKNIAPDKMISLSDIKKLIDALDLTNMKVLSSVQTELEKYKTDNSSWRQSTLTMIYQELAKKPGVPGPKGDKGDKGAQIKSVEVLASYSNQETGEIHIETGEEYVNQLFKFKLNDGTSIETNKTNLRGPMGPKGDKGDTGFKGERGSIGPQGNIGPQGVKGDIGDPTREGPVGPMGPKGDTGEKGDKGRGYKDHDVIQAGNANPGYSRSYFLKLVDDDGKSEFPKGYINIKDGEKGEKGDVGPMGPVGPKGEIGDPTKPGPVGPKGDPGPMGPTGPKGIKGDPGLPGSGSVLPFYSMFGDVSAKEIKQKIYDSIGIDDKGKATANASIKIFIKPPLITASDNYAIGEVIILGGSQVGVSIQATAIFPMKLQSSFFVFSSFLPDENLKKITIEGNVYLNIIGLQSSTGGTFGNLVSEISSDSILDEKIENFPLNYLYSINKHGENLNEDFLQKVLNKEIEPDLKALVIMETLVWS